MYILEVQVLTHFPLEDESEYKSVHSRASDYIDSRSETDSDEGETIGETPTLIAEDKDTGIVNKDTSHPVVSASPLLHAQVSAPVALRALRPTLSCLPSEISELAAKVQSSFKEVMFKALTILEPEYRPRVEARWFPLPNQRSVFASCECYTAPLRTLQSSR